METKDIIRELRNQKGLSQEELAARVFVTRQAISRWENGETVPNTETLKLLSKEFDVSINTLLGSPRVLVCECCGMPLKDHDMGREINGFFNEEYCKWCYADGDYTLDVWKRYVDLGGKEQFEQFKNQLVDECNVLLRLKGLPGIENLNVLPGEFVNLEYSRRESNSHGFERQISASAADKMLAISYIASHFLFASAKYLLAQNCSHPPALNFLMDFVKAS